MSMTSTPVVTISYSDLVSFPGNVQSSNSVVEKIALAFGQGEEHSLGIVAITNVPTLAEKRRRLLPMARQVALLEDKAEVICEASNYQTGWSHGKETFDGKPDLAKGSFYANPLIDDLNTIQQDDIPGEIRDQNPAFFAPNVWPHKSLPELESAFKDLALLVVQVGRLLAKPCDAYVAQHCPGYDSHKLTTLLEESKFCKARLLHYFAVDRAKDDNDDPKIDSFSDWCGWHNDHGSLTGLVPAMYLDAEGNEILEFPDDDDDKVGLCIQSRSGSIHHVSLPPNAIGFQIGETSQIHSGGILQATPHAVRGSTGSQRHRVTRESFAVFMEPEYFGAMDLPLGKTVHDVQDASIVLPSSVRTLSSRWKPGMNFGEFSNATFSAFY